MGPVNLGRWLRRPSRFGIRADCRRFLSRLRRTNLDNPSHSQERFALRAKRVRINAETMITSVENVDPVSSTQRDDSAQGDVLWRRAISPGVRLKPDCFHDLSQWTH